MNLVKTEVRESGIDGKGEFTFEDIAKGTVVWKFDPTHDKVMSVEEYNAAPQEVRDVLSRVAYLSATTNRYVYPPEGDDSLFTNHSTQNNLTVVVNKDVSDEPYFIANRDIKAGEELTNNYFEFDEALKKSRPEWLSDGK